MLPEKPKRNDGERGGVWATDLVFWVPYAVFMGWLFRLAWCGADG